MRARAGPHGNLPVLAPVPGTERRARAVREPERAESVERDVARLSWDERVTAVAPVTAQRAHYPAGRVGEVRARPAVAGDELRGLDAAKRKLSEHPPLQPGK